MQDFLEGEALARLAIASGSLPIASPVPLPEDLASSLVFPTGAPLPPSLRALLAYDASWLASLGWLVFSGADAPPHFSWTPRTLAEIVASELGEDFRRHFDLASMRTCFLLSRLSGRALFVLVVTRDADALGEFPVVLVDVEEVPFLCVMMAGFDVFLGDLAKVQPLEGDTVEMIARDTRFRTRMSHHGKKLMKGRIATDFPRDTLTPRVARRAINPFTNQPMVLPMIPDGEVEIDWDLDASGS